MLTSDAIEKLWILADKLRPLVEHMVAEPGSRLTGTMSALLSQDTGEARSGMAIIFLQAAKNHTVGANLESEFKSTGYTPRQIAEEALAVLNTASPETIRWAMVESETPVSKRYNLHTVGNGLDDLDEVAWKEMLEKVDQLLQDRLNVTDNTPSPPAKRGWAM